MLERLVDGLLAIAESRPAFAPAAKGEMSPFLARVHHLSQELVRSRQAAPVPQPVAAAAAVAVAVAEARQPSEPAAAVRAAAAIAEAEVAPNAASGPRIGKKAAAAARAAAAREAQELLLVLVHWAVHCLQDRAGVSTLALNEHMSRR